MFEFIKKCYRLPDCRTALPDTGAATLFFVLRLVMEMSQSIANDEDYLTIFLPEIVAVSFSKVTANIQDDGRARHHYRFGGKREERL